MEPDSLPLCPPQFESSIPVIRNWAIVERGCSENDVNWMLALLNVDFLTLHAHKERCFHNPAKQKTAFWRFAWRHLISLRLGWKERREEGCADVFNDEVNNELRKVIWPDRKPGQAPRLLRTYGEGRRRSFGGEVAGTSASEDNHDRTRRHSIGRFSPGETVHTSSGGLGFDGHDAS
ncbi:hypothetical protein KC19_12G046500 [Ceratodon purpureus]|uniref:Uncharacterized protein n=1 Tax=Ceratodon purpureus TaxID=3225 RepID=A0A8T0G4Q5_CERPU|nr:hypothetical protein KC19_12G046500 [Ceratodon purpureus]